MDTEDGYSYRTEWQVYSEGFQKLRHLFNLLVELALNVSDLAKGCSHDIRHSAYLAIKLRHLQLDRFELRLHIATETSDRLFGLFVVVAPELLLGDVQFSRELRNAGNYAGVHRHLGIGTDGEVCSEQSVMRRGGEMCCRSYRGSSSCTSGRKTMTTQAS